MSFTVKFLDAPTLPPHVLPTLDEAWADCLAHYKTADLITEYNEVEQLHYIKVKDHMLNATDEGIWHAVATIEET